MTTPSDPFERLRSTVRHAVQGDYRFEREFASGELELVIRVSGCVSDDDVAYTAAYVAEASPRNIGALLRQFDELREDYQATILRANANGHMHRAAEEDCKVLRGRVAELEARLKEAGLPL